MSDQVTDVIVMCRSCTASIEVSVVTYAAHQEFHRHAVDELLVDFGWLPTRDGGYCPSHAHPVRGVGQ